MAPGVLFLLEVWTYRVFGDGVLQILVVTGGYLRYCCLSITFNHSAQSLSSTRHFPPHSWCLLNIFYPFSENKKNYWVVHENLSKSVEHTHKPGGLENILGLHGTVGATHWSWEEISLLGQLINWMLSGCRAQGQDWAWGNSHHFWSHQQ